MNFLRNLLSSLLRGFAHMARRAGDLAKAAALEAQAAASEAVQPVIDRLPALKDGALLAGAGLAYGAGKILGAPGAVLRSILPVGEPTAAQVADAAVARDDSGTDVPPPPKHTFAAFIQAAADAVAAQDHAQIEKLTPFVSEPVVEWLQGLTPSQIRIVQTMDKAALERHIQEPGAVTPGLPAFSIAKPAPASLMTLEERRRIVQAGMASMREAEAAHRQDVDQAREDEYRQATRRALPIRPIGRPGYGH
jgi:hypothetical protein